MRGTYERSASALRLRSSFLTTSSLRSGKTLIHMSDRSEPIGMVGTQVVMVVHTWQDLDTENEEEIGRIDFRT